MDGDGDGEGDGQSEEGVGRNELRRVYIRAERRVRRGVRARATERALREGRLGGMQASRLR